ncbi:DUF7657 domain-containing protein, partial [Pseudomonas viridiflava]|uniref:DUF7657 domain-containing protein n=1 Tax=Pseudomonas viridiflava TaxID=33069 RepID=UPI003C12FC3F
MLRARQRALDASDIALTIIMSLILIYMLIGFGPTLSTYSLWSYVPPNRADLAFGLASLILTHLLIRPARQGVIRSESPTFIAWAVA